MNQDSDGGNREVRIREIFSILKLERTKEEAQIRGAYLALLRETNPEDDPEGFKRLRMAYEEALAYARTEEEKPEEDTGIKVSEWLGEDSESAQFFRSFEEIYASIARRTDRAAWEMLLQAPVLSSLDEGETVKWGLFERLARQYRLPCEIWRLLDDTFFIRENQAEFQEHLPEEFVDFMLYKIADLKEESDFPFGRLTGPDGADFDGFLDAYYEYIRTEWGTDRTSLQKQKDAFHTLELYEVGHPRLELERARLLLRTGETEQARELLGRLLKEAPEDVQVQLACARGLYETGDLDTAEQIYRRYLKAAETSATEEADASSGITSFAEEADASSEIMLTEESRFDLFSGIAELLAARGEWKEARRYALEARKIHVTAKLEELMKTVLAHVIEELKASSDTLSGEDFRILLWSLLQTERGQEGLELLEAHPQYGEDTPAYRKLKTSLYLVNGRNEDAAAEAVRWRACLLREFGAADAEEKGTAVETSAAAGDRAGAAANAAMDDATGATGDIDHAASVEQKLSAEQKQKLSECYSLEGRALRAQYSELAAEQADAEQTEQADAGQTEQADTEQPDAAQPVFDRALRCLTRAVELCPEDLDYRMQKMLLYRDKEAYGSMVEECEQMLSVNDGFYWALFYQQEAYEGLHMAQEVVDLFYRAKRVYAGNPLIYLRAVKVFLDYNQYQDAQNILNQAREAGAWSLELALRQMIAAGELIQNPGEWERVDRWEETVIRQMKREKAPDSLLARAYMQRAYLNEDTKNSQNKETVRRSRRFAEKALALEETCGTLYFLGRYFRVYEKHPRKAYQYLKRCEELGSTFEYVYFYIARCMEDFSRYDDALAYYLKAAERNPDNDDFWWRAAWMYRRKFRITGLTVYGEKALECLERQKKTAKQTATDLRQYALIYNKMDRHEEALEAVDGALALDDDCWLREIRGQALFSLERYDEAVSAFTEGIFAKDRYGEDDCYCIDCIYNCFLRKKDVMGMEACRQAVAYLEDLLAKLDNPQARKRCRKCLAHAEAEQGHYEEARRWIEEEYGSLSLAGCVCSDLGAEAERIKLIFEIWMRYMPVPDMLKIVREHAKLVDAWAFDEAKKKGNSSADRADLLLYAGEVYYYTADFQRARKYFERAYALSKRLKEYHNAEDIAGELMVTYYYLGEQEKAGQMGAVLRSILEKPFAKCEDLGLSVEELMTQQTAESRYIYYKLFIWAWYTGRRELASSYLKLMKEGRRCYWCRGKGCTELSEMCMMEAAKAGKLEAAAVYEAQANESCNRGRNLDVLKLRLLMDDGKRTTL